MNRWINILCGLFFVLVMLMCFVAEVPTQVMVSILLLFNILIFIRERTRWAVVYLFLIVNILYLWFALWMTGGEISYLTDERFTPYYKKTLLLETIFWATFAGLLGFYLNTSNRAVLSHIKIQTIYPVKLQFIIAITILAIEIMISSGTYFKP